MKTPETEVAASTADGSTLVLTECYGCNSLIFRPKDLRREAFKAIREVGMEIRKSWIYIWPRSNDPTSQPPQRGLGGTIQLLGQMIRNFWSTLWLRSTNRAATIFYVLAESSVAIETWVGKDEQRYINMRIHICNFTRDNRQRAEQLAQTLVRLLDPKQEEIVPIQCGPFHPIKMLEALDAA